MDAQEFENISWIILKAISKQYGGLNSFLISKTWQDITDYSDSYIEFVFDLIDNGYIERKKEKQFCCSLLKFIGLMGSVSVWAEETSCSQECLLEIDDYIIKIWKARYKKNMSLYENLRVFLQD